MESTDPQRWARVPPSRAWKHPGLPTDWSAVHDRNPQAPLRPEPLAGYVWLDRGGRLQHTWAAYLEFRDDLP